MVPEAAAAGNLYVSVENAQFQNSFGGGQIVEVIVSNSIQSEPSVLVDGNKFRMALAQDGKWYGYFGNYDAIIKLDSKVISPGIGMDFGEFCANTTPQSVLGIDISKTKGVAIPYSYDGTGSSTNGGQIVNGGTQFQICQGGSFDSKRVNNVLLNPPALVTAPTLGNIGLQNNVWPFIQLTDISQGGLEIVLEQPGPNEIVRVDEYRNDYEDYDGIARAISVIPKDVWNDEDVKLLYENFFFNIDPTSSDVWTFDSISGYHYYRLFDSTGSFSNSDNFKFKSDREAISCSTKIGEPCFKSQSNTFQKLDNVKSIPLTFVTTSETEKNSSIFTTIDNSGKSSAIYSVAKTTWASFQFFNSGASPTISSDINPSLVNDAPIVASATASNSVNEDSTVSMKLDGTDIDSDSLKYVFTTNPSNGKISGTSPNITYTPNPNFNGQDVFAYKVNDGFLDSSEQKITITVNPVNDIPIAKAGTDQSVDVNSIVSLDGSSSDIDADAITYSWIQTAGYPVTLTSSTILNPKFTAPTTNGQLTFMLTVSDGKATSNPAVVSVFVGSTVPVPVPPPSPTKIVATPANGAINLKWSPPAKDGGSPIIDYVIEYKSAADTSWKTFADGKSTNTQTTITGLKNDVKYQFVISAVNSVGSGEKSTPSNAIPKSITPPPAPDPKVLADEKKAADKKAADKKIADKKIADKKAADKKAADKKAAEAK